MGDITARPGGPSEYSAQAGLADTFPGGSQTEAQAQALAQSQYSPHAFSLQYDMTGQKPPGRGGSGGTYNMTAMMLSLPQANYRHGQPGQQQHQRYAAPQGPSAGGIPGQQQMPQVSPYVGPTGAMNPLPGQQQYYMSPQHHVHMAPQYYGAAVNAAPQQQQHQQQHQQHQQQHQQDNLSPRGSMAFYQQHQQQQQHQQYYYPHAGHFANQAMMQNPMLGGQYLGQTASQIDPRLAQQQQKQQMGNEKGTGATNYAPSVVQSDAGRSADSRTNVVRGPPRKPRQSGHAIWIGNLPPQTDLMSLVYHVCKEAPGLESLFLISKSNCAFANFKDEQACISAQQKVHDSKFQTVRLVSRLRKSTVEGASGVTAPTGPASSNPAKQTTATAKSSPPQMDSEAEKSSTTEDMASASADAMDAKGTSSGTSREATPQAGPGTSTPQKDKYYILKSLTVDDLELSVQNGIWATQSHNEKVLNEAFQSADNVYLIFSANKSGEYFGYARMTSPINEDPAAAIEFAPKAQSASDVGLPKAIPTEATEFAPKGSIMDDSERGTIFWEADLEGSESGDGEDATLDETGSTEPGQDSNNNSSSNDNDNGNGNNGEPNKAWGKPFQLEWLSTTRLPFYRTRGLRNPLNSNREVKIARDGTELDPSVGRKLTALFPLRVQSPIMAGGGVPVAVGGVAGLRHQQQTMLQTVHGYPPMSRPPY